MRRHNQEWSSDEDRKLRELWDALEPALTIAKHLGRSQGAIVGRALALNLPNRKAAMNAKRGHRSQAETVRQCLRPPPRDPCAGCGVPYDRHDQAGCAKYRSAYSTGAFDHAR